MFSSSFNYLLAAGFEGPNTYRVTVWEFSHKTCCSSLTGKKTFQFMLCVWIERVCIVNETRRAGAMATLVKGCSNVICDNESLILKILWLVSSFSTLSDPIWNRPGGCNGFSAKMVLISIFWPSAVTLTLLFLSLTSKFTKLHSHTTNLQYIARSTPSNLVNIEVCLGFGIFLLLF